MLFGAVSIQFTALKNAIMRQLERSAGKSIINSLKDEVKAAASVASVCASVCRGRQPTCQLSATPWLPPVGPGSPAGAAGPLLARPRLRLPPRGADQAERLWGEVGPSLPPTTCQARRLWDPRVRSPSSPPGTGWGRCGGSSRGLSASLSCLEAENRPGWREADSWGARSARHCLQAWPS